MKRPAAWLALALSLTASATWAKTICIQDDVNGNAFVLKVGKGGKAVSGYVARYVGGSELFVFRPLSGGSILTSSPALALGLTEYGVHLSATSNGFVDETIIHRIRCTAGADGKIGVSDVCSDNRHTIPSGISDTHAGHIIDCIPEIAVP
jgi:hypothetical protein